MNNHNICRFIFQQSILSRDFYEKGASRTIPEYEAEHLNGQKIQGTLTAAEVYKYLKEHNLTHEYPIMCTIHEVAEKQAKPHKILDALKKFDYSPSDL